MAQHFYDTSAAVKHYRAELGTAKVDSQLADAASGHYLSTLGVIEAHSVLARLVRMGQITAAEFHRLRGRLLADIASGLWRVIEVTPADFQQAQQLLVSHAITRPLRTMDALQLAVALSLNTATPLVDFVCADVNLCVTAAAEGLIVIETSLRLDQPNSLTLIGPRRSAYQVNCAINFLRQTLSWASYPAVLTL